MPVKPNLPLPKGYFGDAQITGDERSRIHNGVRVQLERALADQLAFVHAGKRQVHSGTWRLVKKKRQLRIYRRRAHTGALTSNDDPETPSMLAVGRFEGSIEDVLYGGYDKSHEDLQTTMGIIGVGTADCTVIENLELATPEDPFHFLGVKWFYTQLPGSLIIKPRDWCHIQAIGIARDARGERYGYTIVRSADIRCCPPFDQSSVVRGKAHISFIFREPAPGVVEVFSQALFDPAGELIQHFTTAMTIEVLAGVFRLTRCAEAKKLTLLALRNFQGKESRAWRRDGGGNTKLCARCGGTAGYFSSLKSCGVCGDAVCSQCHVKKAIFVGASHSLCRVPCCHKCIMEARNMKVRPAEPEYSILSGQYLPQEQYSMLENSDSPDDNSTPASASEEQEELAYSQRSQQPLEPNASGVPDLEDSTRELDVNQQRFSCDSGISEDDVEKILASMLAQRQQVKGEYGTDHTSGSRAGPGHSGLLLSNSSDGSGGASYSSLAVAAAAAVATTPASAAPSEMTPGQAAIYYKILALQSAANEAYWMAQANNEIMRGAP